MNEHLERALSPAQLGPLRLRNRIIKSATYEGMSPGGTPSAALTEHHVTLARGGVGLTTVAYGAVSSGGRTFGDQLLVDERNLGPLRALTDSVHEAGGAVSIQLAHCGGFTKLRQGRWAAPSASAGLNAYGVLSAIPFVRAMTEAEVRAVIDDFAAATAVARRAGFDAVEVHLGHGYLLSQFLSPKTNRRRDAWGGDPARRRALPLEVLRAVREAAGEQVAVLVKINLEDGFRGGLELEESIETVRALEPLADAIVMSGGSVSRNAFFLLRGGRPLGAMAGAQKSWSHKLAIALFGPLIVRRYAYSDMFFLDAATRMRAAVRAPLALLGGITSGAHIARAMQEGFDFVTMGRALISDPALIAALRDDPELAARCDHCNLCVAEMDRPAGVRCVLGAAPPSRPQ